MTLPERLSLRFAREDDIPLVLRFIRELADYEHMLDRLLARLDAFTGRSLDDDVAMVTLRFDDLGAA